MIFPIFFIDMPIFDWGSAVSPIVEIQRRHAMIPSVLARQIQSGLKDYIDTTFPITNLVFKDSLKQMLSEPKKVFHEPYVAVRRRMDSHGHSSPSILSTRPMSISRKPLLG